MFCGIPNYSFGRENEIRDFQENQDSEFAKENEIRCFGKTKITIFDRNMDSDVLENSRFPFSLERLRSLVSVFAFKPIK